MMLAERLSQPGPKRLLALDGGGIRGVLTLGYLAKIEAALRQRHDNPTLVLSDYFDLIGGTSTGSIIATMLSLGSTVGEIHDLYMQLGREAFQLKKNWLGGLGRILGSRFDEKPLARLLQERLGERTLSSPDFKAGLVIIVKRADTGSVWKLVNVPNQKFFDYNKDLKLWEIVRASTAAPSYFRPQVVSDVGTGEAALFVDGGVSMHGNPALAMLMVATLKGFGLEWHIGEEKMLLCSVGTGSSLKLSSVETLSRDRNLQVLPLVIGQLMYDASELNEMLLQWLSRSPTARVIDTQIGTLQDDWLTPQPILTYLRYDIELSDKSLATVGLRMSAAEAEGLHDMSNANNIEKLDAVGKAASVTVKDEHFPKAFDLT
jgi:uncharacterized protein